MLLLTLEQPSTTHMDAMKSIAYGLDALIPDFYCWCGPLRVRLSGCVFETNYSGKTHQPVGISIVLPGYRIYSTYKDSYDPR